MRLIFAAFLVIGSGIVSVRGIRQSLRHSNRETCSQYALNRCMEGVERVAISKDLLFPRTADIFDHSCMELKQYLKCVIDFTKRCLDQVQAKRYVDLIKGAGNLAEEMCNGTSYFRKKYLENAPCLGEMSEAYGKCVDIYQSDLEALVHQQRQINEEERTRRDCCYFDRHMKCGTTLAFFHCGKKPTQMVKEVMMAVKDSFHNRCSQYTYDSEHCLANASTISCLKNVSKQYNTCSDEFYKGIERELRQNRAQDVRLGPLCCTFDRFINCTMTHLIASCDQSGADNVYREIIGPGGGSMLRNHCPPEYTFGSKHCYLDSKTIACLHDISDAHKTQCKDKFANEHQRIMQEEIEDEEERLKQRCCHFDAYNRCTDSLISSGCTMNATDPLMEQLNTEVAEFFPQDCLANYTVGSEHCTVFVDRGAYRTVNVFLPLIGAALAFQFGKTNLLS